MKQLREYQCSKIVAVGFNTLRYDASVGVLNSPHESSLRLSKLEVFFSRAILAAENKRWFSFILLSPLESLKAEGMLLDQKQIKAHSNRHAPIYL